MDDLSQAVSNLTLAMEHLIDSVRSLDSRLRVLETAHAAAYEVRGGSPRVPPEETCKYLYGCLRARGSWCFNGDCTGHSNKINLDISTSRKECLQRQYL